MRGIVISNPVTLGPNGFRATGEQPDAQEMRTWLLFWDKLDWPSGMIIYTPERGDTEFLISKKVLQRTQLQQNRTIKAGKYTASDFSRMAIDEYYNTYRYLEENNPGSWSMAIGPTSFNVLGSFGTEGRGLLLKLHRVIPVPNFDVPLDDILSFREKRQSELIALREHIDGIYNEIVAAPDRPFAETTAIQKLERSAADYSRSAYETKWKLKPLDLSARFSFTPAVSSTIATYYATNSLSTAVLVGATTLITGAKVQIGSSFGFEVQSRASTPFQYVASYHNEVFIGAPS